MLRVPLVTVAALPLAGTVTRLNEKLPDTAVALSDVRVTDPLSPNVAPALKELRAANAQTGVVPRGPRSSWSP
jgi:hypothetical protein